MAMMAHDATDISDQDHQQRLAHDIALGDEVAEAQGRVVGVHVHFSRSNSIGMQAQPAVGWPFSV